MSHCIPTAMSILPKQKLAGNRTSKCNESSLLSDCSCAQYIDQVKVGSLGSTMSITFAAGSMRTVSISLVKLSESLLIPLSSSLYVRNYSRSICGLGLQQTYNKIRRKNMKKVAHSNNAEML